MKAYLDLIKHVLENGERHDDRTGVGTLAVFGTQTRYDLREGFPLVTTKKVPFNAVLHELLWFLSGDTNIRYLVQNNVKIWNEWAYQSYLEGERLEEKYPRYSDAWSEHMNEFVERVKTDEAFAQKWGDLGPVYGKQWRRWEGANGETVDQIQNVLDMVKNNPNSRRIIVSGWNVADLQTLIRQKSSAPPPCHTLFHFNVGTDQTLDLQLYQRSADIGLGVPFNIASYATLLMMVAQECNLTPRHFVHTIGNAHIYTNHVEQLNEQLTRTPKKLPTLEIADKPFWDLKFEDFELKNYEHDAPIRMPIAV
ncbi:thymidylate synthase [Candidatus Peregrinibacteria bacterium]|nr:MAG: thymidylate synthase [Candidatus Peregrinibacteria bacterium]